MIKTLPLKDLEVCDNDMVRPFRDEDLPALFAEAGD